jgi:putative ABC transport system permease protein
MLWRKLFREIWIHRLSFFAVSLVLSIGIGVFVSSYAGYENLRSSYRESRQALNLADFQVMLHGLPERVDALSANPAIQQMEIRGRLDVPARLPDSRVSQRLMQLRLHGLPEGAQPALNQIAVLEGRLPLAGEVVLERNLMVYHALQTGDSVRVTLGGADHTLTIVGSVSSAEYPWVARNPLDLMPSPEAFGVAWMVDEELAAWAGPEALSYELLIEPGTGGRERATVAVRQHFGPEEISSITPQEKLLGIELVQLDVDGFRDLSFFFPLVFLIVAAFISGTMLGRLVDAQRPIIGTLRALGFSRRDLFIHYSAFAVLLGGGASCVGGVLGWFGGWGLTHVYAKELGVSFVSVEANIGVVVAGICAGTLIAWLSVVGAAWRATNVRPAMAMKAVVPSRLGWVLLLGPWLNGLPLPLRMAARNVLRRPVRGLTTSLGVAGALVIVLMTAEVLEGFYLAIDTQFDKSQRFDLRADMSMMFPENVLKNKVLEDESVTRVETMYSLPVQLRWQGTTHDTLLQGGAQEAELYRNVDFSGRTLFPEKGGVIVSRNFGKRIGIVPGDQVLLTQTQLGRESHVRVDGFSDSAMGNMLFMERSDAQGLFGSVGWVNTVLVKTKTGDVGAATQTLEGLPMVARIQDLARFREQVWQYMRLAWMLLGVMLLFSVVLSVAILYNTATLSILERRRELATLRCLGQPMSRIVLGISIENGILAVIGLAIGVPASVWAIQAALRAYESDLYSIPFVFSPIGVVTACLGVVCILWLAQRPALAQVRRLNLADEVRERVG